MPAFYIIEVVALAFVATYRFFSSTFLLYYFIIPLGFPIGLYTEGSLLYKV